MHKNEAMPSLVVSFYSQDNNAIFILNFALLGKNRARFSYRKF